MLYGRGVQKAGPAEADAVVHAHTLGNIGLIALDVDVVDMPGKRHDLRLLRDLAPHRFVVLRGVDVATALRDLDVIVGAPCSRVTVGHRVVACYRRPEPEVLGYSVHVERQVVGDGGPQHTA